MRWSDRTTKEGPATNGRVHKGAFGRFSLSVVLEWSGSCLHSSSCDTMGPQWSFRPRPATGWRLNGHLGLVPPRDSVSMVILISSRRGMTSQRSFWPRPAAGWRLNRHLGLVPPRDDVSTVILAPSRRGTPRRTSRSMSPQPPSGEISSIRHTFPPEVARASIFACA